MEATLGDIVIVPFPFSNLKESKLRPALVVARLQGDDMILAQITSVHHPYSIPLRSHDFAQGKLPISTSYVRFTKLFTADTQLVLKRAAHLSEKKKKEVAKQLQTLFSYEPA